MTVMGSASGGKPCRSSSRHTCPWPRLLSGPLDAPKWHKDPDNGPHVFSLILGPSVSLSPRPSPPLPPRHKSPLPPYRAGRGGAGPLFQDSVIPVFHILSILCLVDRIALVLKQNGQVLYECISASSRGSISLCIQSLEVPAIKRKLSCTKLRVNAPHTTYILTGRLARPDSPSRRPWAAGCLGTKTTPPKEPHSGLASSPLCRHKGREAARRPTSRRHLAPRQHRWNMYYSGAQPGNKGQNLLQLRSDIRKDK